MVSLCLREAGPGKIQQSPAAKPPPAAGIRQSPRLNRKRPPNGDADQEAGVVGTAQKQRSTTAAAASAAAVTPGRKRCKAAAVPGSGIPRARAGVLVGETPQKRPGVGATRSSRRGGRAARTSVGASPALGGPASPAAAGAAPRKSSKKRVAEEPHIPCSPSLPMGSPAAGPTKRCRAMATGPASPAESLFVAESPGVSTGSVRRRGRVGWATGVDGDGVSRQLMAESASPVGRRPGAVVPGTPA